jgi:hypothetical protein
LCDYSTLDISQSNELTLCGYPQIKFEPGLKKHQTAVFQYGLARAERLLDINEKRSAIYHTISSYPGQSGAPLLLEVEEGKHVIFGIHKGTVTTTIKGQSIKANAARLLTSELIDCFRQQAVRMKAESFEIYTVTSTLTDLNLSDKQLSHFNLRGYSSLLWLNLSGNRLSTFSLANNNILRFLSLYDNQLQHFNLANNSSLTYLYLGCNKLTSFDIGEDSRLTLLSLRDNQLGSLNLRNNNTLARLWIYNNPGLGEVR